ncbi:hypothetical protein ACFXMT_14185 [Streptomyces mirabilis]|uniref:hypothetical protein n=1 Tax=Streptomyces mirabilis TaxID=68239 RepID=UPI00368419F9
MIYNVFRTDDVQPGEFVSAVVIAPGKDLARKAFADRPGVVASGKRRNVEAAPLDTTGPVSVVSVYHDETPTLDDALADVDPSTDYDSALLEGDSF